MIRGVKFESWDWFRIGGGILLFWAIANTTIDIRRYGVDQGFYWWFCNLALIGTAFGLLTKHRGWLTGFLSIACFTQVFWVIDNQYRIFFGENLFGLVEFMYQPGLPIDEFILSHYHYFTIPIAIVALIYLPKQRSNSLKLILIFNPLIFGISYFVFPPVQNVNCIHEPCFPSLQHWAGPVYSFLFWLSVFAVHIVIGIYLENFFYRLKVTKQVKKFARQVFVWVTLLAIGIASWDTVYKMKLPSLKCTSFDDGQIAVECRYTLDYSPGVMLFNYRARNGMQIAQSCTTKMRLNGVDSVMDTELLLAADEERKGSVLLPYPKDHSRVQLLAQCKPARERDLTGEASE